MKTELMKDLGEEISSGLREAGINTVTITFSGGGDSGQIDSVKFEPESNVGNLPGMMSWKQSISCYTGSGWETKEQAKIGSYEEAIEDLCYAILEETDVDWINNDGGDGVVKMTVYYDESLSRSAMRYKASVNQFYQSSYNQTFNGSF